MSFHSFGVGMVLLGLGWTNTQLQELEIPVSLLMNCAVVASAYLIGFAYKDWLCNK